MARQDALPPLRVAFDMDGTVADMASVLKDHATRLFGPGVAAPAPDASSDEPRASLAQMMDDELRLTSEQQSRLWEAVRQTNDFWTTLPEAEPGIVRKIAATARARGWEVLFITTRPSSAGDTTQRQTQRWLDAHGFAMPAVTIIQRSRGRLADVLELDAVVDDRAANCVDVASDSQARPILVWRGSRDSHPGNLSRLGIRTVTSTARALAMLERMDDARQQSPVVRTIKRVFGRD